MSDSISTIYDEAMHDDHVGGASARGATVMNAHMMIAIAGSIVIVLIAMTAKVETYYVSPIFLVPLLWIGYWLRERFAISVTAYAAFFGAILLHDLGAYGFYQNSPLPFSWDILVHFYFAIPAALIIRGALRHHFPELKSWQVNVTTVMFVMGVGALHEIMEFASYLMMGDKGMLKTTSYIFDTSRDLTNNLLGCLTALVARSLLKRLNLNSRDATRRASQRSNSVRKVSH